MFDFTKPLDEGCVVPRILLALQELSQGDCQRRPLRRAAQFTGRDTCVVANLDFERLITIAVRRHID